jgi:hypothetical protein
MAISNTALAALIVAIYAALISTVTGIVQVFNYRRDRAQIALAVGHDMVITTTPMREGLTIVNVMNRGRRPVTISSVGAWRLYPHKPFVIPETHPDLPHELREGQKLMAIIPPSDLDLSTVQRWEADDATAHSYVLNVAPWHARLVSNVQWYFHLRQRQKAKSKPAIKTR